MSKVTNPFQQAQNDGVSFLPEDYIARKSETRANLLCLSLFGVVMFAVIGAFFVTNRQWLSVRREQETINKLYTKETMKIEQLKSLEEQKTEMLRKAEITTALIEKVPRSVLLADLVNRMPENITLESLELKSKRLNVASTSNSPLGKPAARVKTLTGAARNASSGQQEQEKEEVAPPKFDYSLTLVGVAVDNKDITDYVTTLKESGLLDEVELNFIEDTTKGDIELRKFEIAARIRPDADARSIEAPSELNAGVMMSQQPSEDGPKITVVPEEEN